MSDQMPTMPVMPVVNTAASEEASLPKQADTGLHVPSHELVQPAKPVEIIDPAKDNDSSVSIPLVSRHGIKVVATRKGFYGQQRIKEGQAFVCKDFKSLGAWMKCLDPVLEKERQNKFNKKAMK